MEVILGALPHPWVSLRICSLLLPGAGLSHVHCLLGLKSWSPFRLSACFFFLSHICISRICRSHPQPPFSLLCQLTPASSWTWPCRGFGSSSKAAQESQQRLGPPASRRTHSGKERSIFFFWKLTWNVSYPAFIPDLWTVTMNPIVYYIAFACSSVFESFPFQKTHLVSQTYFLSIRET